MTIFKGRSIWLDPRTKLLLLLLCVISASLSPFRSYNTGLVLLACLYGTLLGKVRYSLLGAAVYGVIYLFTMLVLRMAGGTLQTMLACGLRCFHAASWEGLPLKPRLSMSFCPP